jgi:hypothetical protein
MDTLKEIELTGPSDLPCGHAKLSVSPGAACADATVV